MKHEYDIMLLRYRDKMTERVSKDAYLNFYTCKLEELRQQEIYEVAEEGSSGAPTQSAGRFRFASRDRA
ncbi:hypothetical protein EWM64_g838 [Hericium alpestre]|uniref:Uncharacterized protein n=1 Tax=Hericium alpestre TaxID=135208 RepID=A0A4Z0AA94_9AGAM|nr:hypothetical protein EWM64_g838 [Hericium alpestre]